VTVRRDPAGPSRRGGASVAIAVAEGQPISRRGSGGAKNPCAGRARAFQWGRHGQHGYLNNHGAPHVSSLEQTSAPSSQAPVSPSGTPSPLRQSILIVDDEEIIRELLHERITYDGKTYAEAVANGEEALAALKRRAFDLVLTDIRMPGMSGIDLLRRIKETWPETAVIIMSGYAELTDTIQALRHGAVDFLEKPFEMSKVLEAIDRVFRMKNIAYSKQEAMSYLESENRVFVIPNNLDLCPIIVNEVTQNLADKGITDVSFLESIRVALNEMLFNAIEHGNLAISFEDKTRLMEFHSDYHQVVRERAAQPEFAARRVRLEYSMDSDRVAFTITDEGQGFDHSNLPDPTDPANLLSSHGRGILMARIYMDDVIYNEKGNQVTLIRRKK